MDEQEDADCLCRVASSIQLGLWCKGNGMGPATAPKWAEVL